MGKGDSKKRPPDYLIVPRTKGKHVHKVMIVRSRDFYGRPRDVTIMDEGEVVNVTLDNRFITGYIPEVNFEKRDEKGELIE